MVSKKVLFNFEFLVTIKFILDTLIASITSKYSNDAIFLYTAAPSTSIALKRQRRAAADDNVGTVFRDGANFLLYYTSLSVVDPNDKTPKAISVSTMSITGNATNLAVTLKSPDGDVMFDIYYQAGYFLMSNFMYNNVKFRTTDVYSPTDFSYYCGNLTLYSITNTTSENQYMLQWNSVQMQAPFNSTNNATFVFGDPWHCVGFFTGGILSGLLVVALLLTITFIGVCWMMDINTMDRFDDPKGKTITINASE